MRQSNWLMYSRRPFLKWAGGKHKLVNRIMQVLPDGGRLVEPFVGSAALFLGTNYPTYLLADTNADLINLYRQLASNGKKFIEEAAGLFSSKTNTAAFYYDIRSRFNESTDHAQRAAFFLYLNRHAYNGLCRYNSSGSFNVPFGKYVRPYFPKEELTFFAEKCSQVDVHFECQSFQKTFGMLKQGDIVYCDPPYFPLSSTSKFTSYTAKIFSLAEQDELARLAEEAKVPVVISNHDTKATKHLYSRAGKLDSFPVRRSISCKAEGRKKVMELLACYHTEPAKSKRQKKKG